MPVYSILKRSQEIVIALIVLLFCFQQNVVAQDTLSVPVPAKHKFIAEPLKASMMAVVFPGLGQVYNRKYWKIPLVYAGFGGLIYSVSFNSTNYNRFMKAYQDFTDAIPETNSYVSLLPNIDPATYDPVLFPKTYDPAIASNYEDQMLRRVDYYKKYRDLSYIGIAAWYLISILDANVDASLFNYDISNNLDVAVFPSQVMLPGGFVGAGLNVSLKIDF